MPVKTDIFGFINEVKYLISPGLSAANSKTKILYFLLKILKGAIMPTINQLKKLLGDFLKPKIANGAPVSLFKFPCDLSISELNFSFKTSKIASLVEVFPTEPVTAIISGLDLFKYIFAKILK